MTLIGYMRVSTDQQNHDLQYQALRKAGVDAENIFSDTVSGKTTTRSGLEQCLKALKAGDTLVVWKLDRLGRRVQMLYSLVQELRERGVYFKSIMESFDTSTTMGKAMFGMMAVFAEMERDTISDRTKAGLAATRKKGTLLGRPRTVSKQKEKKILELRELSIRQIAQETGVNRNTVYRVLRSHHIKNSAGLDLI